MACREDETQQIVADVVVERRIGIGVLVLLDFELAPELVMLARGELAAAKRIEGAMLARGHEPGARPVRDAG